MEILIHQISERYIGACVGTLLDSARAEDVEVDGRQDWYLEGRAVRLAEHEDPTVGGASGGDPAQRLILAMTQNTKWLVPSFEVSPRGIMPPILVSTSRDAVLHSLPIEVELFCKKCNLSADFLATLKLCASWLARSERASSIMERVLRHAEATSTLGMVLPVNLAYRGEELSGALRVESILETISSGTLYLVANRRMSFTQEALRGIELMRRVQCKAENRQEVETLEAAVGKVRACHGR